MAIDTVVVTRHPALVSHLCGLGLIPSTDGHTPDCEVIDHATPAHVAGMHVIGVLPLHLAALAAKVTEVPLYIPEECRGRELTLEEVQRYAGEPSTYRVHRMEN